MESNEGEQLLSRGDYLILMKAMQGRSILATKPGMPPIELRVSRLIKLKDGGAK